MSFVIISAYNALYGPTAISTEDSVLHEQISSSQLTNALTISRRRHKHDKSSKLDKVIRKCENKLADCHNEVKAEKLREKMEYLYQRKKDRIALNEETKVNFDPYGKSIVFKVEDAPVRVLNLLAKCGYTVLPGGNGSGNHDGGIVWTLYKPDYVPTPIYPKLSELTTTD